MPICTHNWKQAKHECNRYNADLIVINYKYEADFFLMPDHGAESYFYFVPTAVYIGLTLVQVRHSMTKS